MKSEISWKLTNLTFSGKYIERWWTESKASEIRHTSSFQGRDFIFHIITHDSWANNFYRMNYRYSEFIYKRRIVQKGCNLVGNWLGGEISHKHEIWSAKSTRDFTNTATLVLNMVDRWNLRLVQPILVIRDWFRLVGLKPGQMYQTKPELPEFGLNTL